MGDSHVVSGLKAREEEIKKRILRLRKEIKACREDLDAVRKPSAYLARRGALVALKIVLDALRINPEGPDVDQLAAIVIEREGFDPNDKGTVNTIRQRCIMSMYSGEGGLKTSRLGSCKRH
jgi:hypothetical protein